MIELVLDDTLVRQHLFPFTLTRSSADIRIGILTIREKWEKLLGCKVTVNGDGYLNSPVKNDNPPVVFSGNIVPGKSFIEDLLKGTYSQRRFLKTIICSHITTPLAYF